MAANSRTLPVKLTAIILVVLGFLIFASGYRYGTPSSMIGGVLLLAIGIILLVVSIARRSNSNPSA